MINAQREYMRVLKSASQNNNSGVIKTIRIFIAEFFLGLAMDMAPDGTEEKTDITDFCVIYFSKQVNTGDY